LSEDFEFEIRVSKWNWIRFELNYVKNRIFVFYYFFSFQQIAIDFYLFRYLFTRKAVIEYRFYFDLVQHRSTPIKRSTVEAHNSDHFWWNQILTTQYSWK
jgi:hypothetical protein